ncbi:MAG: SGNH/GDSL hydrolase family protein [Coleofasciculaceae cyanobacterium]
MFKSRRSPYLKRRRRLPLSVIILAIPLALIILELLAVVLIGITGKGAELAAYEGEPAIVTAYTLRFLGSEQEPYDGLSNRGHLAAQRSLGVGYSLVGNQQSEFWSINEQGFRDNEPVPLAKPKNEIRIFLLGGSTAFGQRNEGNQATIASKLEERLNQRVAQQRRSPEKYRPAVLPFYKPDLAKALALPPRLRESQYRLINAAVPGYVSGNELAQLFLQIMPYSPDVVLILDGYTDLMLPSDQGEADIPQMEAFLGNAPGHFWSYLTQQFQRFVTDTTLVKALQYWLFQPEPSVSQLSFALPGAASLEQQLPADAAELELRAARYRDYHKQMIRLTTGAGIPLVIAVQPEITGRGTKQISDQELKILEKLGENYSEQMPRNYSQLLQASRQLQNWFPNNVKVLNLYKLYEDFPEQAFSDAIHLTEKANEKISESFYYTLTALSKLQIPFQQR